jgi:hypothetical protein
MFRREVIEGEQFIFVLGQSFRRFRIFRLVFLVEHRQCFLCFQAALDPPNIVQIGLDLNPA